MAEQKPYRARRVDNNVLVYGDKVTIGTETFIVPDSAAISHLPSDWPNNVKAVVGFVEVHPESVSQSTGLKDKHGVEIYGGMKLKSTTSGRELTVYWCELRGAWTAKCGEHENYLSNWCLDTFEIITEGE